MAENQNQNGVTGRLSSFILRPLTQAGFAGLCGLLLALVGWQQYRTEERFDKIIDLQRETNQVIERNTAAITELSRLVHDKL